MRLSPVARLDALVARGETLAGLERLLQLSPGYLSKVRRESARPSPQLAALLALLVLHPEVRATLEGALPRPRTGSRAGGAQTSSARRFAAELAAAFRRDGVRFQAVDDLLLEALEVEPPASLDPSIRFLVHPDDRRGLARARELGASVATASSHASVCTPRSSNESVVLVFPLQPLHQLLRRRPLAPVDAALYFALQADEAAEQRFSAVCDAHRLSRDALEARFAKCYGGSPALPPREWLLRSSFDLDIARERLAKRSPR